MAAAAAATAGRGGRERGRGPCWHHEAICEQHELLDEGVALPVLAVAAVQILHHRRHARLGRTRLPAATGRREGRHTSGQRRRRGRREVETAGRLCDRLCPNSVIGYRGARQEKVARLLKPDLNRTSGPLVESSRLDCN